MAKSTPPRTKRSPKSGPEEREKDRSPAPDIHFLRECASFIEALSAKPNGTGRAVPPKAVQKRVYLALMRLRHALDLTTEANVSVRVKQVGPKPSQPPASAVSVLLDIAAAIDELAGRICEVDYVVPLPEDRKRLKDAINGLQQSKLAGTGVQVSAGVGYPQHRPRNLGG